MAAVAPSIHASAVLIGAKAALIRGPAGSGKSRLAFALIEAARQGALPFALLVADDRAHLEASNGQLLVRPTPALAGMIEMRGLGIRKLPFESVAAAGLVIDLAVADADRLPAEAALRVTLEGVHLPRLALASGVNPLPLVLAFQLTGGRGI
jgi:HPr kinase/phosphorylase